ncbi:hypothetical protein R3I93_013789 [Phoxinus phoxinus]|uniref:Uncharacterized protein n=1 Tax=Phoxinus phoxinus TaxID=58324 RepID=A0AAN9CR02_9TELE
MIEWQKKARSPHSQVEEFVRHTPPQQTAVRGIDPLEQKLSKKSFENIPDFTVFLEWLELTWCLSEVLNRETSPYPHDCCLGTKRTRKF